VFNPAGLGENLPEFALRQRLDGAGMIKNNGTRTGGALIKRKYAAHGMNMAQKRAHDEW
jgi:hypothetical protein